MNIDDLITFNDECCGKIMNMYSNFDGSNLKIEILHWDYKTNRTKIRLILPSDININHGNKNFKDYKNIMPELFI